MYGSIQNLFVKSSSLKAESLSSRDRLHPDITHNALDEMGVVARVFLEGIHEVQYKSVVVSVTLDIALKNL